MKTRIIKVSNNNVRVSIPNGRSQIGYAWLFCKTQQTAHFGSAMKESVQSQGGNINPTDLLQTY